MMRGWCRSWHADSPLPRPIIHTASILQSIACKSHDPIDVHCPQITISPSYKHAADRMIHECGFTRLQTHYGHQSHIYESYDCGHRYLSWLMNTMITPAWDGCTIISIYQVMLWSCSQQWHRLVNSRAHYLGSGVQDNTVSNVEAQQDGEKKTQSTIRDIKMF